MALVVSDVICALHKPPDYRPRATKSKSLSSFRKDVAANSLSLPRTGTLAGSIKRANLVSLLAPVPAVSDMVFVALRGRAQSQSDLQAGSSG
jgi:hypothetical protein